MDLARSFLVFFALTLVALGATVATGLKGRVRVHLPLVAVSLACLVTTIWFAERLGEEYDLESAGRIKPVHLAIAKTTSLAYLLPLVTGVMTLRDRRHRKKHRIAAIAVLVLTVAAAATGAWMVFAAEPLSVT